MLEVNNSIQTTVPLIALTVQEADEMFDHFAKCDSISKIYCECVDGGCVCQYCQVLVLKLKPGRTEQDISPFYQ